MFAHFVGDGDEDEPAEGDAREMTGRDVSDVDAAAAFLLQESGLR